MPSFTHSDLYSEVKDLIRPEVESERIVDADWVIPVMEKKHPMPRTWRGVHAEARRIAYREHIRDLARGIVREFKKKETNPDRDTPLLPGFKFVQRSYQIDRSDKPMVIPIDQMTDQEIQEKADELDRMADGCRAHAAELRRYLGIRQADRAA
jgi:hypothetical protein